jgi:hypothetical protein
LECSGSEFPPSCLNFSIERNAPLQTEMLEQVGPVLEVGQQQLAEGVTVLAALEDVLEVVHLQQRELLLGQLHWVGFSHCKTRGQLFLMSNCTTCFHTVERIKEKT